MCPDFPSIAVQEARSQVIGGKGNDTPSESDTEYTPLTGTSWETNEAIQKIIFQVAGTLKNFKVKMGGDPGAGKSYVFTIRKNGVSTDIVVTIADTATEGEDSTHTVSVAKGDELGIMCVPSGTPTIRFVFWGIEFKAD